MEKQFIPYELALELKELGFDEKCFKSYRQQIKHEWYDIRSSENITFNKDEKIILSNGKIYSDEKYLCDAPLWQQAFDWFRKEKGFDSWVVPIHYIENGKSFKKYTYIIEPVIFDETFSIDGTESENYEEARIECLKKLIELRKNVK